MKRFNLREWLEELEFRAWLEINMPVFLKERV